MLQCERINLQHFDINNNQTIKAFFNNAIADGYFANPGGEIIAADIFKEHYEDIFRGISEETDFEFYKNGQKQLPVQPLQMEEVLFVTAFANEWNNRQYFIETKNAWLLFGWATMA